MTNMLVTGGAGFIGANYVRRRLLREALDQIVVLDALTYAANRASISGLEGVELIVGDICDGGLISGILKDFAIDTIVHFAAESHVDRSIAAPDVFLQTNVIGTHTLLAEARREWLSGSGRPHRFHHISTDEVYGTLGADDPAFNERTPFAPNSPYAASKASSDHLVRAYHHTYGLEVTITNCSNNYGPYQFPEKLIPLFIINALQGSPLPVYGDGLNIRDWLHVDDHCRAIDLVLDNGRPGETYNVGGKQELTNRLVVSGICTEVDRAFEDRPDLSARFPNAAASYGRPTVSTVQVVPDRPGHDRRYAIDPTKIECELGFDVDRSFTEGLRETLDWYLDNEAWWRA